MSLSLCATCISRDPLQEMLADYRLTSLRCDGSFRCDGCGRTFGIASGCKVMADEFTASERIKQLESLLDEKEEALRVAIMALRKIRDRRSKGWQVANDAIVEIERLRLATT